MNDKALVAQFQARNEEAIAGAKAAYGAYCLHIAKNLLFDDRDAEECLNDVLFAAWNSIPPHNPENLKTYLGKITREAAVDRLRKRCAGKRIPPSALAPLEELEKITGGAQAEEALNEAELSRAISDFLRTVGPTERTMFVRRYWFFDPIESICRRCGCKKSKAVMTLKRTRDKLALYLKKEGFLF